MRNKVIGQTGSVVLSDDSILRKRSKKRTVRYQYRKVKAGWTAWVCGPFHSRTYGVQGFGSSKKYAKAALQRRLANDYGYLGHMLFSDVDESDTVGLPDMRLLDENCSARPITVAEVW
jgi:hypothetical protein